ncbi:peptide/nickel transport system substrate-binding protein [Novosphingobium sp. SG751A]|uniref:ABC transporter substrate-binding protein n=1 Tax=Novosphingobium sp. SG751A TaxID=2587000 RepID=UPI0020A673FE|nr:ABC transporter substrate-binding protein [Novosphingobium sp. SG751A]NOW44192.1 peptide/nickel transport system substrate-binding protein [Novosphingobium sp. SG751A]
MMDFSRRAMMLGGLSAGLIGMPAMGAALPKRGGSIRVATQSVSTADTLDPAKGALSTDYVRHYMLYSGLTRIGHDLLAHLSLAERLESADRITWHVALRRGVHFHHGGELTSADVVFSLLRHKDPKLGSKMASIAGQFVDVRADGRYGVVIRLSGPNADLPAMLAQSHFLIVRHGVDRPDGNGTGPFRLADFKPGIRTVVVRNPDYWVPGKPYLDRIELIAIPDEVSRVNALLAGDVQLVNAVAPHSTRRVEASPTHAIATAPSALYSNLITRMDRLPSGNPDFIAALKHLIDRPLVKRALFRGYATIGNDQPIPPFHPYYNPAIPQTALDLDRAKWHVQRGGLQNVRLPIFCGPAVEGSVDMASVLQEYGARVGLDLAITRVPSDGYWSTHWMRHPLSFGSTNPRPTADLIFSLFYKSDAAWNETGWKNPRFDQLLLAARGETNEANRKAMYGEMQQIVHDRCGSIIPVFISLIDGHDRRLQGLNPLPMGGLMGYQFAEHVWWAA